MFEDGQYWAFTVDLGNNTRRSPKNGQPLKIDEMPWFKFSAMECCMTGGDT